MALEAAIERAVEKLRPIRLGQRCASLGIPEPEDGRVAVRMFGADALLDVNKCRAPDMTPEPLLVA